MLKVALIIFISLFTVSCAVVPVTKPHSARDRACGLSTHQWNLDLVKAGHYSASCNSPECILVTGVAAIAVVGVTAIVSGSIVLVGNVVHWVEQQGRCDAEERDHIVSDINTPLIQQGGKPIRTKRALEKELEEL